MNNEEEKTSCCCHEHEDEKKCTCGDDEAKGCECCDGDCDGDEDKWITLTDEATGEEVKGLILFTTECDEKDIAYIAFGDFDDEEAELNIIPFDIDEDRKLSPIDIDKDPRSKTLEDIFNQWQSEMEGKE